MVSVKTKKYQLTSRTYIKMALLEVLRQQWWVGLIALAIAAVGFLLPDYAIWFVVAAVVALALYVLFWVVQFVGVTQMDQFKVMFERFSYELNTKMIVMRVNTREGMQFGWENVQRAEKTKDAFILRVSRAQFIHLPFAIFNSDHDLRFTEALLKRKRLLPETPPRTAGA